jgi:hypothetical protein
VAGNAVETRWLLFVGHGSSVQGVFLFVVVFWITMIFASFGLSAPRNATVVAVLFVSALSVAGALFLILEMDDPYEGLIKLPSAPYRYTLAHLGQ